MTSADLYPTLALTRRLSERGSRMWVRFVLVPGLTDDPANVEALAAFASGLSGVDRLEVLPFHQLGSRTWAELGLRHQPGDVRPPSDELVARVEGQFRAHGLPVG